MLSLLISNCLSLTRFQEGSQGLNLTKQPLTVPERLKEGRYLRLKGGEIDAEERGDQNALGFVSIGPVVVEKCTINHSTGYAVRVPPCTFHYID